MQNSINESFFELLKTSIGTQQESTKVFSDQDWEDIYNLAVKQSLAGIVRIGVEKVLAQPSVQKPPRLMDWICMWLRIESQNKLQNRRAKELYDIFREGGYRSCVLKGQGTATYYDTPQLRQCGDIDLWVEGDRNEIVKYVQSRNVHIESVDVKDSTMSFFDDVMVEVHFLPNCMYSPLRDRRLQSFYEEMAPHIFSEGIGLRQLVDYYYILKHSSAGQREKAFETVCGLGMRSFTGGVMYILQTKLGMDKAFALCEDNVKHGIFLLKEILIGGNFGHYDNRYQLAAKDKKFKRGMTMLKRNMHLVIMYPSEVLWSPVWKLWHWCWRKVKGYL